MTVNFSEGVAVAGGTPYLKLNDGGIATYTGSGTSTLTFQYIVAAGQNASDLRVTALTLNGASIQDGADNNANLSGAAANPSGTLQIDTTAPTVTQVFTSPTSGQVNTGRIVRITLDTNERVDVSGSPSLLLNDGEFATYDAARSSSGARLRLHCGIRPSYIWIESN